MKKTLALLMALAMMLCLLAGCGGSNQGSDNKENGDSSLFRIGVEAEFTTLDTLTGGQVGYSVAMANGVYETLFNVDSDGNIVPGLATEYEWQDDNTLVITLREGITFHNGNAFTADDVLFSLNRYYDSPQYTPRLQWVDFDASYAENDYTVVLKTTSYSATLVGNLTSELMLMLDKEWYDELNGEIDQAANGTGPYKLKAWNMGSDVEIEKNEDYWGDGGYFDEIDVVFYNDASTAVLEFEAGNLDAVYVQNYTDIERLMNDEINGAWCAKVAGHTISGLCMSSAVGDDFVDGTLREAICHAIPVEELVNGVSGGTVVAQNSIIPDDDAAHIDIDYYDYDIERASSLVEQYKADHGLSEVTLEMVNVSGTLIDNMAEAIQAYLDKIGITVNITSGQATDVIPRYMAGEVNFCLNQSGGGSDPADIFSSMERGGNPAAVIPSEEALDLLDAAKASKDWNERLDIYAEFQHMVHDEYLFLPLYENYTYYAVRDGLTFDFGTGHYPDPVTFGLAE